MEVRIFQIVVPVLILGFIINLIIKYKKNNASSYELAIGILFWISVTLFAIFPDHISKTIAKLFGIKSNVNAIIFFCIGIILFFQFKLYASLKKQQKEITTLTRKIALQEKEAEDK